MRTDAAEVSRMLADEIESLCAELLPNGGPESGSWRVGSLSGEKGDSLSVSLKRKPGLWIDHATDESGDALGLVRGVFGCDTAAALRWSRQWLGIERGRPSTRPEVRQAAHMLKADPGPAEEARRALAAAARYILEMRSLIGTPGEAYLRDLRRIEVAEIEDVLARTDAIGWYEGVFFNQPGHFLHAQRLGAIIGIMTDPVTAKPTGAISRTYLAPDGTKVLKAKTLGSPRGIVRLSRDDEVLGGLFLAEGLETALSGMAIGLRPMWAAGDCGLVSKFPLLDGIEALTVMVDHDTNGAGERAARDLEARWLAAGRRRTT